MPRLKNLCVFCVASLVCATCVRQAPPLHPGSTIAEAQSISGEVEGGLCHSFVLVAIDGVRWQEIFNGVDRERAQRAGLSESEMLDARELTPNLHALADDGIALGAEGRSIWASGPNFMSLPGYMEMLSGRRPTGCLDNGCAAVRAPTLADEFAAEPGANPLDVAVISSWDPIERAAAEHPERLTISTGRSHGLTRERLAYDALARELLVRGAAEGPEPGEDDYRRDAATAAIALHYLASHRPRFVFVGLGDTDEYAHHGDYRRYLQALIDADAVVGQVLSILASYTREGRSSTLFVTTDHGRAANFTDHGESAPESAAVWLVAAGAGVRRLRNGPKSELRHLSDIARAIRLLDRKPELDPALGAQCGPEDSRTRFSALSRSSREISRSAYAEAPL